MKKITVLILCLFLCSCYAGVQAGAATLNNKADFELVESVPLATIYGQPGVRRTPQVWLDMINNAQHSIALGAFYFETKQGGGSMTDVVNALLKVAQRGVKIRIILDGSFYKQSAPAIKPLMNQPNIQIRVIPMGQIAGGIMHAKYLVVDHSNVYVGSANFDWKALSQVHEIGARVRNERLAATILHVFNLDWALCKKKSITQNQWLLFKKYNFNPVTSERPIILQHNNKNLMIHVAFSPKVTLPMGLDWEQQQFVRLLDNAQHQVLMQVLTYSPDAGYGRKGYWSQMDNAIRRAAGRGVKVKLIVSNWSLKYPMINYIKSLSLAPNVQIKISSVPPYKNQFIPFARVEHCKYMVVDNDLSWIGTGNWQWSYFYDTRNLALIINGVEPNKQLQGVFFRDWNGPYTQLIDVTKKYHAPKTH